MKQEIYELMDETMEINHQIGKILQEFAQLEEQGKEIKVKESKILKTLFEQLQQKYRLIVEKIIEDNSEKSYEEDYEGTVQLMNKNELLYREKKNSLQEDLQGYLEDSYLQLRYIPLEDNEGKIIQPCIFDKHPYYNLKQMEYEIQKDSIENMQIRLDFKGNVKHLSAQEKADILTHMASEKFYKTYAFEQINKYISQIKASADITDTEKAKTIHALLEEKYILYYEYLNQQYNGILQENDIDEFAIIQKFLEEEGTTRILLKMDQYEIDENIKLNLEKEKKNLKEILRQLIGKNSSLGQKTKKSKESNELKEKIPIGPSL